MMEIDVSVINDFLDIEGTDVIDLPDNCWVETSAAVAPVRAHEPRDEEWKRAMSEAKKGKKFSAEHKAAISAANKGKTKTFSEEHKENISKSLIGNSRRKNGKKTWKPDEEYKKKMSEIKKGKKPHAFTEETRRKMSEAAKRRHAKKSA